MFKIYVPVTFLKYSNRKVTMQYQIDCSIRLFYQPTVCFIRVVKLCIILQHMDFQFYALFPSKIVTSWAKPQLVYTFDFYII